MWHHFKKIRTLLILLIFCFILWFGIDFVLYYISGAIITSMLDDIKVSQQEIMTDFLLLLINIYLMFIEKEGHVSVYF